MDEVSAAAQAEWPEMDRLTVVSLMAGAGHLTHDALHRRYLLSRDAIRAGAGRNVQPMRGFPFPIVYPEYVPMVLRSLAWDWIKGRVALLPTKTDRREFLARFYAHLPMNTLVRMSGASSRSMERAVARHR